jgi:hypothetical protein
MRRPRRRLAQLLPTQKNTRTSLLYPSALDGKPPNGSAYVSFSRAAGTNQNKRAALDHSATGFDRPILLNNSTLK